MKKIALILAVVAIAVSASAQRATLTGQKWSDNIYVGVAAGAETMLKDENLAFSAFNPNLSIMVGKNFNPVFGLRLEAEGRFNAHKKNCPHTDYHSTVVNGVDVNLLGTFNMMNLFAGYKGEPRGFEITALYGFGWGHQFGNVPCVNTLNSKAGFDFAYNFGKDKQFQIFLEPSITWVMAYYNSTTADGASAVTLPFQYDVHRAVAQLQAGFIYKFPCSNGKHNFAIEQVYNQSEIDAMNAKINEIRSDRDAAKAASAAALAKIADLQKQLADCQNKPVVKEKANLAPSVVFELGKSVVRSSQMANVEMIAKYMKKNPNAKVKISGYASPEGNAELNQKLSEKRAAAVKDVLVKKYKIAAYRLSTEGLGATDKLFEEIEFNRVALFNDTTK